MKRAAYVNILSLAAVATFSAMANASLTLPRSAICKSGLETAAITVKFSRPIVSAETLKTASTIGSYDQGNAPVATNVCLLPLSTPNQMSVGDQTYESTGDARVRTEGYCFSPSLIQVSELSVNYRSTKVPSYILNVNIGPSGLMVITTGSTRVTYDCSITESF